MPDEKITIHFTLKGAEPRENDFVESTHSPFFLCDAREQINKAEIPSCFSFLKDGIVVQSEHEKSISAVDCLTPVPGLTENRLVLVINFSALRKKNEERKVILDNKDSKFNGGVALEAVNKTKNILDLLSKIGGAIDGVVENYELEEQATAVMKDVSCVMSYAPCVGIAFAAIGPVLTAICNSNKVAKDTITLFDRLETLLTYLDDVVVYVVEVKRGSSLEGDKTFCMLMTLIDQSFAKIMEIHNERHVAGFWGRVQRIWRSNDHLKDLSDLDNKITRILIETTALDSMKYLRGIQLDVEKSHKKLKSLSLDFEKKGETTEVEIKAIKARTGTLVSSVETHMGISALSFWVLLHVYSTVAQFQSRLEKSYTNPNYPNQNERAPDDDKNHPGNPPDDDDDSGGPNGGDDGVNEDEPELNDGHDGDQISEEVPPQAQVNQSIQAGAQIDSVLQAALFLNMIFLTLAYKLFQMEDNERKSFYKAMKGKELSDYLKQERDGERDVLNLRFLPGQARLFAASCTFIESLGDNVILHDIDSSEDCTFGIFINEAEAEKRITIVFRPMITAPNVVASELKISALGILPEEIDVSRFSDLIKDNNIGKVCLHGGYYDFAHHKYDLIKGKLKELYRDNAAYKDFSLYVTGHSFGAAIANIVSFLMVMDEDGYINNNKKPLTLSTFGSPRVGNIGWRDMNRFLGKKGKLLHLRVSRDMDIIPSLPPKCLGFYHTGMNLNLKSHYNGHSDFVVSKSDLNRIMIPPSLSAEQHILAAYWDHIVIVGNRLEMKTIVDIYDDMKFYDAHVSTAFSRTRGEKILYLILVALAGGACYLLLFGGSWESGGRYLVKSSCD
mmetsp:Transcript_31666/g.47700  ORF Transcript_31666/g.47700 Transcript_31666/m.47700 type:complete len:843 (+) Transcript_31666:162-2690(+)|eukprot:scaffold11114_cov135-Skeletonema_dohrnii-CCMP3373.AAC.1